MAVLQFPRCRLIVTAFFDDWVRDIQPAAFEISTVKRSEWFRNAARAPDKATIEIDYRDFPVDPRLISAIHVAVFVQEDGAPDTLCFVGYVDTPTSEIDANRAIVRLECRDYTRLGLDRTWRTVAKEAPIVGADGKPTKKTRISIPKGQTLGGFVDAWRKSLDSSAPTAFSPAPTVFEDPSFRGLDISKVASGSNLVLKNGDTAWDALLTVCEWYGLLPVWTIDPSEGPVLLIRSAAAASNRTVRFVWGENVERFKIERNLQAPERKRVRVVAYNPRLGKAIAADYPPFIRPKSGINTDGRRVEPTKSTRPTLSDAELDALADESYLFFAREVPGRDFLQGQIEQERRNEAFGRAIDSTWSRVFAGVPDTPLPFLQAGLERQAEQVRLQQSLERNEREQLSRRFKTREVPGAAFLQGEIDKRLGLDRKPKTNTGPADTTEKYELARVQYNLYGDYTQAQVNDIAKRLYEDQGRQRILGTIKTRSITDSAGVAVSQIGNGDRLIMKIDPATLHGVDHMDEAAARAYLSDPARPNALPDAAAYFISENLGRMRDSQIEFYVVEARHTWDSADGYSAEIDFSDFIVDRPR